MVVAGEVVVGSVFDGRLTYSENMLTCILLPDDTTPDPLFELSQGQAIVSVMPVLSGWASTLFDKFDSWTFSGGNTLATVAPVIRAVLA